VNATSVEAAAAPAARSRSLLDRALAAFPYVGIALAIVTFYCVEAWTRKTPWLFTDELEWTQISRAIESTGHAARRGEPIFFKSLYAVLIAPFWGIHSTGTAYAAIKYANAFVMSLAAIPTYLLARMLVPRRSALVVAVLTVCIPGMAYVTTIVPEVLAYPWYALCSWLIVRWLVSRRPLDFALAAAATVGAQFVRWPQLATVIAAWAIAEAVLWWTGPRGRAFRHGRSRTDLVAVGILVYGGLMLFNRVVLQKIEIWQVSTQHYKGRMVDLGLDAGLAFTVGMGILPVVGGLAAMRLVERRGDPAYRAFAAYLATSIVCISVYAAVKAAYLSTVFSTLTEERNMIYLSPLMLIGSALVVHSRRVDWRLVAAAAAFVVYLVFANPFQLDFPYFEAPGFAILTIPTRHWRWTIEDLRLVLMGLLALAVLAIAFRRVAAVAAAAAMLCCAWMLTAEIAATVGFDDLANRLRHNLPAQLDWVDRANGRAPTTYLGQAIKDPNGLMLTEFWNRSIQHVYSLDGSAPGPGPAGTPEIVRADGLLARMPDTDYVLGDFGLSMQAEPVARWGQLTLYHRTAAGPWKLHEALQQVYNDSWVPEWSTYTYFKAGQRGTLEVTLSRTAFCGDAPVGHAGIVVGTVRIDPKRGGPVLGRIDARRKHLVENCKEFTEKVPVARTPVRAVVTISPTFRPLDYGASDPRNLGAQVSFRFVPAKPS
jgi:hypothetical protein